MTIRSWLIDATARLKQNGIPSAKLDAELILSDVLCQSRTWLYVHYDDSLPNEKLAAANSNLQLRINYVPVAYIVGHKEFYGREFLVTSDVLIPRPETEALVEFVLNNNFSSANILDIGTGSGAIAITLALELLASRVMATDISPAALKIARQNATKLGARVKFVESNLLANISNRFELIVANLPYVDRTWEVSPETKTEPELALFAEDNGLSLIKKLITQANQSLSTNGTLLLEMDPRQIEAVANFVNSYGYEIKTKQPFLLALQKFS